jgi:glutathione S-transferase
MLQLHTAPGTAGMAPHILLKEIGLPFEWVLVDPERNAHKAPAYLRLNPNGVLPTMVDGDLVLYESAAICLHLADSHPEHRLAPPLGSARRAQFYKWLVWMTNTLQATLMQYFYPERLVDAGNAEGAAQVKRQAEQRVGGLLDQVEAQLAAHGGPWLLGDTYSAADPYLFMLGRWTRNFQRPARGLPQLGAYLRRMLERPAVQSVLAAEQLPQPWI